MFGNRGSARFGVIVATNACVQQTTEKLTALPGELKLTIILHG